MVGIYFYTLEIALLSTLVAVAAGIPAAYFTARRKFPGRRLLLSLSAVPLCVPALIMALGYVSFWGMNGAVNRLFGTHFSFLYSSAGIVIAQGFYNFPLVMGILSEAWERLPREQENAARLLGAGEGRIFWTITLRQLSGAVGAACIPVFLFCYFSFMIVLLFSPVGRSTLEVEIYHSVRTTLDIGSGARLAVLETLTAFAVVLLYSFVSRRSQTSSSGIDYVPYVKRQLGFSSVIFIPFVLLILIFLILPLGAVFFILGDQRGVTPSNVDQGYILRRLIRRSIRFASQLNMPRYALCTIAEKVIDQYGEVYSELIDNREKILSELRKEENRFADTLKKGIKEFNKLIANLNGDAIDGVSAFHLYDTYGFPIELTVELAKEKGVTVDEKGFAAAFEEHQKKSQAGAEQRFKGGLADNSEATAALHSATHLLQAALRKVLKDDTVSQKGSNITAERLRFDFSFGRKVTDEELREVERLVNEAIKASVPITCEEMTVEEAKAQGAIGLFESKYGEKVKVYTMGPFSKEICGGPHAKNTGDLGRFEIKKEEASSSGVRRIKAVLIHD